MVDGPVVEIVNVDLGLVHVVPPPTCRRDALTSTRPPRSLRSWVGAHAPTAPVISSADVRAVSPTHRNLVPAVRAFVMRFAEGKHLAAVSPASARQILPCTTPSPAAICWARASAECIPGRPGSAAWLAVLLARPDEFLVEGVRPHRGG
jgi:hypothetical protein